MLDDIANRRPRAAERNASVNELEGSAGRAAASFGVVNHGAAGGMRPRVLVATLSPYPGGVTVMRSFVLNCLRRNGFDPILAFYQPYSTMPRLSVPAFALLRRRPMCQEMVVEGYEAHAIGSWLPELEFTHHLASRHWRRLIAACDYHIAVIGSSLQALAFASRNTRFLAWVATPWESDRKDRVAEFRLSRRVLDRLVVRPIGQRLERKILRSGRFLALSDYTRRELDGIAQRPVTSAVLPMPIDSSLFRPRRGSVEPGLVVFAGRFDDARKNASLFLASVAAARRAGLAIRGVLIGGKPTEALLRQVRDLGLGGSVEFRDFLPRAEVASLLCTVDVFVIPSHQEGLCIAGLEAMAAGCPVVSTRCGGPEEYVLDGETGYLADSTPSAIAKAVGRIVADRALRDSLAAGARRLIETKYSFPAAEALFWAEFDKTFSREKTCRQS